MATVVKNFRIKSGLVVEGTTGTINGQNILTETGGDAYILNLVGGATLVKSVGQNLSVDNAGQLSLDLAGISSDIAGTRLYADGSSLNVDVEGIYDDMISNGIATTTNVANAKSEAISAAADDATTKANNAYNNATAYADGVGTAANGYTDSAIGTEVGNRNSAISDAISTEVTNRNSAIATAKGQAEDYTDTAISNLNLSSTYDAYGAAAGAEEAANLYTDGEIAALVDSAPALLDTLNELAAAIANNPNYATDVANLVSTKADTTYVDSEISDLNTAAQGYATTAKNDAKSYADSLASNYDVAGAASSALSDANSYTDATFSAEIARADAAYDLSGAASTAQSNAAGYTDTAVSNLTDGSTQFSQVNIAGYTRQVGKWTSASTAAVEVAAFTYSTAYGSAEFLVRVMSNTAGHQHSQLSKILITTDGSGNVAITEYGIVTTNGNMGDVSADVVGGNVRLLVTPAYDASEVIVSGTLLAYND